MKNFSLLSFLFLFLSLSLTAQSDLSITAVTPQSNTIYDTVSLGETIIYKVTVTNLGPNNISPTDTVVVQLNLDFVIPYPGFVLRSTTAAGGLNLVNVGGTDTFTFSLTQGVSLGQTPSGPAIVNIPNYTSLNNIIFGTYGHTATNVPFTDPGTTIVSGNVSLSGNNVANPQGVSYSNIPTYNPVPTADLQIIAAMPVTNGVYPEVLLGDTVRLKTAIKNLGPNNLNTNDTVFVDMPLDWLIPFPGYRLIGTYAAGSLNSRNVGGVDTIIFTIVQGVSLGQTPNGAATVTVPNFTSINTIEFRVRAHTVSMMPINDVGASISSGSYVFTGNNIVQPTNVVFGQSLTPTISIDVNQNPSCFGSSVTFTANVTNPGSSSNYEWKLNGNVVNSGANSTSYTINTLSNNDEVSCTYTTTAQGSPVSVSSNIITMIMNQSVTPSIDITPNPGSTVYSNTIVNFTATTMHEGTNPVINWYKNQVLINNENDLIYIATAGTDFQDGDIIHAELNSSENCAIPPKATSNPVVMHITGVGINGHSNNKTSLISLYPNPNSGVFTLNGKLLKQGNYSVRIFNQLGQTVYVKHFISEMDLNQNIDFRNIASGLYLLELLHESQVIERLKLSKY
ncbi:MAG TPA: T9SS type A sorting domain-containing protein [Edaphocola sp.]|nr:T9SS type A sorting domain-containing protein [Edaphocola sp.]